ncbi:helix-turn-helix transcriptional regulator [Pedobacter gandavensis]|uniref:helix-turn-helix domain-containing protein n=1 Tax=Pedobacter TaxID=84567 RepID=UPI001C99321A|nr:MULTISPECIES: helix-turn-helix transcriptional regulator [Pedobacter]WGQ09028.1 helix-turn-helix transcriptional regulator [Pedobacter gandavensis]
MPTIKKEIKVHHGRNIKRFRDILDIKQETIAHELGDNWNQGMVSRLEKKETIDRPTIERIAAIMKIEPDAIERFTEDNVIHNINSFYDNSTFNFQCTFNPVDKFLIALEDNKSLYERLVSSEQEKVKIMEKSNIMIQELIKNLSK